MKVAKVVSACLFVLISVSIVSAQETQPGRREDKARRQQPVRAARDTTSDTASQGLISELATLLAIKNQEEIELSKFALEKTQNDEVKQFAQKMIDDHTKALEKLQQFHPQMDIASLESQETPAARRTLRQRIRGDKNEQGGQDQDRPKPNQQDQGAAEKQDRPQEPPQAEQPNRRTRAERAAQPERETTVRSTTVTEAAPAHSAAILQVSRETARICLEMTKEKLGSKEGQDFDRCYVGGQIVAHVGMVAKLQAMQTVGTPEFNQFLEKGAEMAQEHLKHAESLAQQLESQTSAAADTGAREPGPARERNANRERERNPNPNPNPNPEPNSNP